MQGVHDLFAKLRKNVRMIESLSLCPILHGFRQCDVAHILGFCGNKISHLEESQLLNRSVPIHFAMANIEFAPNLFDILECNFNLSAKLIFGPHVARETSSKVVEEFAFWYDSNFNYVNDGRGMSASDLDNFFDIVEDAWLYGELNSTGVCWDEISEILVNSWRDVFSAIEWLRYTNFTSNSSQSSKVLADC